MSQGMADLVLDVGALRDLLVQYFQNQVPSNEFVESEYLPRACISVLNRITRGGSHHMVVASSVAFVELCFNWQDLIGDRIECHRLAAFLDEPPEWFTVEPLDEAMVEIIGEVSSRITIEEGRVEQIEWTDAVHAATALARDRAVLITSDHRLNAFWESRMNGDRRVRA